MQIKAKQEMIGTAERTFEMDLVLCGDIIIKLIKGGGVHDDFSDRIFGISFNTSMTDDQASWVLARYEIDGVHKAPKEKKDKGSKDKEKKGFCPETFTVTLRIAPEAETPKPVRMENSALNKVRPPWRGAHHVSVCKVCV